MSDPVDMMKATKDELVTLNRVGPVTAGKIIRFREGRKDLTILDLQKVTNIPMTTWQQWLENEAVTGIAGKDDVRYSMQEVAEIIGEYRDMEHKEEMEEKEMESKKIADSMQKEIDDLKRNLREKQAKLDEEIEDKEYEQERADREQREKLVAKERAWELDKIRYNLELEEARRQSQKDRERLAREREAFESRQEEIFKEYMHRQETYYARRSPMASPPKPQRINRSTPPLSPKEKDSPVSLKSQVSDTGSPKIKLGVQLSPFREMQKMLTMHPQDSIYRRFTGPPNKPNLSGDEEQTALKTDMGGFDDLMGTGIRRDQTSYDQDQKKAESHEDRRSYERDYDHWGAVSRDQPDRSREVSGYKYSREQSDNGQHKQGQDARDSQYRDRYSYDGRRDSQGSFDKEAKSCDKESNSVGHHNESRGAGRDKDFRDGKDSQDRSRDRAPYMGHHKEPQEAGYNRSQDRESHGRNDRDSYINQYRNSRNGDRDRDSRNGDRYRDYRDRELHQPDRDNNAQRKKKDSKKKGKSRDKSVSDSSDSHDSQSESNSDTDSQSSDSSSDKDRKWRKQRKRSPLKPKMPVFDGDPKSNWDSFIYQFQRIAKRQHWSQRKKASRLLDCLKDKALEYAKELKGSDFKRFKRKLHTRYSHEEEPSSARRKLQYTRQKEDEPLVDFCDRVEKLVRAGHPKANRQTIREMEVEAFLKNCKDKEAAKIVMDKEPKSIAKAVKEMKKTINNRRALFGTRSPHTARQVTFSPKVRSDSDQEYEVRTMKMGDSISDRSSSGSTGNYTITSELSKITDMLPAQIEQAISKAFERRERRTPSPSPERLQKMKCFKCREYGHMARDCPKKSPQNGGQERSRMPSPVQTTQRTPPLNK
jgi:hypothetical protein